MATVLGERRVGTINIRSSNGIPVVDETFEYLVEADDINESRVTIVTAPGLPITGITTGTAGVTICQTKNCTRDDNNALLWHVTCSFSSEVEEGQQNPDPQTDPEEWVPIYETKFERLQEIVTKDQSGTKIANSAGQPFENGLTITRFIPVWEFWQIESASISDETIIDRNEVVNSSTFLGRAAKTLLCTVQSSQIGFYYGATRRLTKYSLKYNDKTWQHRRLDVGTVYLDAGVLKPYLDDEGNVILGGLNGSGAKVTAGQPPAERAFDMYATNAFSFLRTS